MAPLQKDEAVVATSLSISNDDLVAEAWKHVAFLQGLHELSVTLTKPSLTSLDRYLNYWLPLVSAHMDDDEDLIPAPDIAWLWHCHRLAPARYERHVMHRFHKLVETPQNAFDFQVESDERVPAQGTRRLWQDRYPHTPFFLSEVAFVDDNHNDDKKSGDNIDVLAFLKEFELIESTTRQATFLWQVSGVRYCDADFLHQGAANYIQFLQLFGQQMQQQTTDKDSRTPLVPSYQIDLLWHTHMLKSIQLYNHDCIQSAGQRFNHDDSLNDRTEGGTLDRSFQATSKLWKDVYGTDYVVQGGMYRGEPPSDYWDPNWQTLQDEEQAKKMLLLAGSFSTGKMAPGNVPLKWLKANTYITFEGQPTFIAANARSRKHGVNNNEIKENYIFGEPQKIAGLDQKGVGYYHMYTREGWAIMIKRLAKREARARSEMETVMCENCACGKPQKLSPRAMARYEEKEKIAKDTNDLVMYAKAQWELDGPGREITPALVEKFGLDGRTKPRDTIYRGDGRHGDYYLFYYHGAAACGGGVTAGVGGGGGKFKGWSRWAS